MTKPIRVGIVGTNANRAWAHDAHIPALKNLRQFSIVAVSARTQTLAEEARRAFDVPRGFGDSFELVRDPEVDLVTVTVKVPEHRAVVLAALDAGKHVYCEWPLGRDLDEALELQAAVRPGSHVAIGFQGISAPAVRRAADIVQSGALGQLRVLRMFSPTAGWGADAPPFLPICKTKRMVRRLKPSPAGIASQSSRQSWESTSRSKLEIVFFARRYVSEVPMNSSNEAVPIICSFLDVTRPGVFPLWK